MAAYPKSPSWIDVPKIRNAQSGLEPSLADVESHIQAGHPYTSQRHITWCHETTHGINANLRNQRIKMIDLWLPGVVGVEPPKPHEISYMLPVPAGVLNPTIKLGNVNAFYILGDRGLRLPEPNFQLKDVAKAVPEKLRGMSYQTYLVQQQQYWNDSPLYILDEWSAYLNGLTCGLENDLREASYSDLLQAMEFMGYAWVVWDLDAYGGGSDSTALRDAVAYQTARTMMLFKMCKPNKIFGEQHEEYLTRFIETSSKSVKSWCGLAWFKQVFEEQQFDGIF